MNDDKSKTVNQLNEILKKKKALHSPQNGFNANNGKGMKPQKGFGGPSVMRKSGRGR